MTEIKYLIGECNYGGRVTDDKDLRVLHALLEDFIHLDILKPDYKYKGIDKIVFPNN